MDITYEKFPTNAVSTGEKLAKIGQEKLKKLTQKYNSWIQSNSVQKIENPVPQAPTITETKVEETASPVENTPKENNYNKVINDFSMMVYAPSIVNSFTVGARKIKAYSRVATQISKFSQICGKNKFELPVAKKVVVNFSTAASPSNETTVEKPTPSFVDTNSDLPSVDDYLQKENVGIDNGTIEDLSLDVKKLKDEADNKFKLFEELKQQYQAVLDAKNAERKRLEQEKLDYTATLEGLTDKIKALQEAIANEKQTLEDISSET